MRNVGQILEEDRVLVDIAIVYILMEEVIACITWAVEPVPIPKIVIKQVITTICVDGVSPIHKQLECIVIVVILRLMVSHMGRIYGMVIIVNFLFALVWSKIKILVLVTELV
jgi:hypothetical protein